MKMLKYFEKEDIKELREKLGLTMKAFGERLGVSEGTVSLWESGDRSPKVDRMQQINELAEEANGTSKNGKAHGRERVVSK